jgi:GNAT superfamily N-acetyltransferase
MESIVNSFLCKWNLRTNLKVNHLVSLQLDNAIFDSLIGRHAHLSIGDELARRYDPDYSPLSGLRDLSDESFLSLSRITGLDEVLGISFTDEPAVPPAWDCFQKFLVSQMVCEKLLPCKEFPYQVLENSDILEMRNLVKLTQPGPFRNRTHELGTYIGIKDGASLIAMAGERIKVSGCYDEVSAVCTLPDYQGRGYARALVYAISDLIRARGHVPFLHVRADNESAIRSYESVGFRIRRNFWFGLLRRKA